MTIDTPGETRSADAKRQAPPDPRSPSGRRTSAGPPGQSVLTTGQPHASASTSTIT